jgi:hypothetical protein
MNLNKESKSEEVKKNKVKNTPKKRTNDKENCESNKKQQVQVINEKKSTESCVTENNKAKNNKETPVKNLNKSLASSTVKTNIVLKTLSKVTAAFKQNNTKIDLTDLKNKLSANAAKTVLPVTSSKSMVKVETLVQVQPAQEPKETPNDLLNKTQTKETSSILNETQIKDEVQELTCTKSAVVHLNQSVTKVSDTKKPIGPSKNSECYKQPPRPISIDNKRPNSFRSASREPAVRRSRIGGVTSTANQTQPLNKTACSPFADLETRLRHGSVDRTPSQPMYKGLRFVPKPTNKYFPTQNTPKARTPSLPKIAQQNRSVLLPAPVLNKLQSSNATVSKSASFNQHSLGNFHRNGSLKPNSNNYPLRALNLTQDSISKINESSSSSSMTKRASESLSRPIPGLLHTELRALRRNEFEQQLKEKERMAVLKRRDLELEKMRKQQEEINKIRSQTAFKSNPIKQYKPVEVKPSERPLTEPRSPQFNASMNRQRSVISNSTSNLSSFKA